MHQNVDDILVLGDIFQPKNRGMNKNNDEIG